MHEFAVEQKRVSNEIAKIEVDYDNMQGIFDKVKQKTEKTFLPSKKNETDVILL